MDSERPSQDALDAVLDAALDELDDEEESTKESVGDPVPISSPPAADKTNKKSAEAVTATPVTAAGNLNGPDLLDMGALDDIIKQLVATGEGDNDAALNALMHQMQSQLVSELQQADTPTPTCSTGSGVKASPPEQGAKEGDVEKTVSKLLEDMASQDTAEGSSVEEDAILNEMMKEFEKMGGQFNSDDVVDGMMQQLLSKDLMYEPMKQVAEKFPAWLEENKETLSEEEYKQRSKQYQCFQQLIHVYEVEPDNTVKLMELMQQVQEFGQPPPEIIKDIAPGLELDADGVPRLDTMGGMPFNGDEECRVM